ncbi:hypothetical protein KGQ90_16325 [Modicisalibacter tunisiensis]|uniref:hypothetical protein n=1 Tax=Modicisalibacter tunisiensis TaxID=390637 RepID=UPI001CC97A4B|nr:hypothetical protein [Modicisalibacter tunisiensis]MBZ9540486.1 hypothetical protein [Modicisalibacter tunisiensis]
MTETHSKPSPEFVARQRLRHLSKAALSQLLRAREPVENIDGDMVRAYQAAGTCWRDDDEPTTEAEESQWEMALAFLELEGVTGLERDTAEILDAEGDPTGRMGVIARLTDEGERQALDLLRRWGDDSRTLRVHILRAWLATCAALAIRQAPSDHPAVNAILDHGRQLVAKVRHLLTMEEGHAEAAHRLLPEIRDQLSGLVAMGEDGTRVYARDVWAYAAAEADRHRAAIRDGLANKPEGTPEELGEYGWRLLKLARCLREAAPGPNAPEAGGAYHA